MFYLTEADVVFVKTREVEALAGYVADVLGRVFWTRGGAVSMVLRGRWGTGSPVMTANTGEPMRARFPKTFPLAQQAEGADS